MSRRKLKAASSAENSRGSNSLQSDSEDGGSAGFGGNQKQMSSAAVCASLGLNDVDLEWSEADYQNLTTFNIFIRMVRPQLAAANGRTSQALITPVLEAKWREFQASNPFKKERKVESSTECDDEEENADQSQNGEAEEANSSSRSPRTLDQSDNEDDDQPEEDEEPEEEEESTKSRRSQGLKIKLSIKPLRKSSRESRPRKAVLTDKAFEKMLDSDDESGSDGDQEKDRKKQKQRRPDSDSNDGASDSFARDRKRRGRKPARKDQSESDNNSSGMDGENFESRKKRDRKKKRAANDSDDQDGESSQRASNSDESDGSSGSTEQRRKKKKQRPVIPGERKSSRARKANATMRELTDREFEKLLEQEEKDKANKKRKRQEKRSFGDGSGVHENSVEESGEEKKKIRKQEKMSEAREKKRDGGESGNESDHYWYCELCRDGGDLLLCDTCPKSFHKECLKLEIVPDGEWSCPVCTGEGLPEKGDSSEEDNHETFCRICKDGGDVILCDFCPMVYHMNCLNPPLKSLPDGDWKCPLCVIKANPPKAKVKTVLTWRWMHQPKDADELDHTHSPQKQPSKRAERELFVKYEYHSYWDCAWIPEQVLEVFQSILHNSFRRKFDLNEPPALEDGSSFGRPRHKASVSEDDPHNLEERYYRYGIKPEWLQIHRIITHDGKSKDRRYLVKWRDLPYIDCTWEFPDEIAQGLEGFDKHVEAYWTRRKQKVRDEKELKRSEVPKKSLLRRKMEKQPDYIEETGGTLHPYQLEGLNWLRFSWSQGTNTILADEMGLGKTIQAITFLYGLYKEGYITSKPFLISAPLSTVANWEREFEFWAPELYVVTYLGQKDNRAVIREQDFSYREGGFASLHKPCRLREGYKPKFDVLLTSYEFVSVDFATLASIDWGVLIIDEAHRLKNNQSLFFRTLNDYKIDYKLLLTGTPLQNNLEELFNLLNFLEPDKFSKMENFLNEFSEISKDEQVLKLHDMLAPHMLRRMKADVLKDIPSKSEFIVRIELCAMQKKYYKHILTKNYEALNAKGYSHQTSLINIMMDLRKCCNHTYLFPAAEKEAPISASGMYEGLAMTKASGKLEMLAKMLRILKRDGHRVLIFSQMTRMLDILEDFLAYHGYGYERIDGSISGNMRQDSIDRFNSPESSHFVFLLSTRAGGLGINLATADTVIIYDMDWNPHNDIQAFSRAHRIGQKNKVMIYRFVTRNTVEEKIAQVCKTKMMLSELIVHRGMGSSLASEKKDSLTKQEISDILKYGAENLFKDDEEGQVVYSDEAVEKLLDRSQEVEVEKEKEFGMNEYLRSFKVASYQVKEGVDYDEEVEEEKEDEPAADGERKENETDVQYWQRVLGPAYHDHVVQTLKEQEEVQKTLGKGKRVRKQINYAEKEMMDAAEALSKGKKKTTEEDILYQSDYEPTSDSDDEDASVGDDDGENSSKKRKLQKSAQLGQKGPPVALPPLVERNEGQVLVLGFTARQRRAFLDAVMRYGMPPEDPYRSQWLVRDLRGKPERVFKAYVSLFMRHLCEPIAENAEKFADGVPREGLSRQHVLTRIGIIALIRKKVHEFEEINGTESMAEFNPACALSQMQRSLLFNEWRQAAANKAKAAEKTDGEKPSPPAAENGADRQAEDVKSEQKSEIEGGDGKAAEESIVSEERSLDKKSDDQEVSMDLEEGTPEKLTTDADNIVSSIQVTVADDASQPDDTVAGADEEKATGEEIVKDKDNSKDIVEEKEKNEMATENAGRTAEDKATEDRKVEADQKEDGVTAEEVNEKDKDDGAVKNEEQQSREGEVNFKLDDEAKDAKNGIRQSGESAANGSETDKTKINDSTPESTKADVLLTSIKSAAEIAADLRRRFWIADGGFTELHSLWHLEEMQLVQGKEHETWHRRHDFWLLAGVITHGYRHWQDILSDPRFDLMNQAFKSDSERTRKAAFLNRRFQLLEQALVIEEQLRKASVENAPILESAPENSDATCTADDTASKPDHLKPLDDLANSLKNLGQGSDGKGSKNPKLHKVLGHIAALVNDINDMSYTNMPASLAKAYTANAAKPLPPKIMSLPPMKSPSSTVSVTTGPWVGGYKPIASTGAQSTKPMYMHMAGCNLSVTASQSTAHNSSTPSTSSSVGEKSKDVICID